MNMTDNDKELAMSIWNNGRPQGMTYSEMFHLYHTAKLEKAASGFDDQVMHNNCIGSNCSTGVDPEIYRWTLDREAGLGIYQAGAASQQPKIAQLREEVERLKEQNVLYENIAAGDASLRASLEMQLRSAQLDNKRLRDGVTEISTALPPGSPVHDAVMALISTPLDTSAADEMQARVKELEEKLEMGTRMVQNSMARDQQRTQQLTAARSALEEAKRDGMAAGLREASRLVQLWLKDPDVARMTETARDACRKVNFWHEWLDQLASDAITGALGEEQKKDGQADAEINPSKSALIATFFGPCCDNENRPNFGACVNCGSPARGGKK